MTHLCQTWAICMFLALICASAPAAANEGPIARILCAPSAEMRQRLETRYRAHRAWAGLRNPDEVMELWENADGDWALIIVYANEHWCIVAMGDALLPYMRLPS